MMATRLPCGQQHLCTRFSPFTTHYRKRGTAAKLLKFSLCPCKDSHADWEWGCCPFQSILFIPASIYSLAATFLHPSSLSLPGSSIPPPSPASSSPLLRLLLHRDLLVRPPPPACWCRSMSPSSRGPCIGWRRIPALLSPPPRPPGSLRILCPDPGPPRLSKQKGVKAV